MVEHNTGNNKRNDYFEQSQYVVVPHEPTKEKILMMEMISIRPAVARCQVDKLPSDAAPLSLIKLGR